MTTNHKDDGWLDIAKLMQVCEAAKPSPWNAYNMVHEERGDAMTPEELGEYVKNSVIKSANNGGSMDRFLFISCDADNTDICHIGNGPYGPANAEFIATFNRAKVAELLASLDASRAECAAMREDAERWRYIVTENNKGMHGRFRIVWFDENENMFTTAGLSINGQDHEAVVRTVDAARRAIGEG